MMTEHVRGVVEAAERRIGELQGMVRILVEQFGGDGGGGLRVGELRVEGGSGERQAGSWPHAGLGSVERGPDGMPGGQKLKTRKQKAEMGKGMVRGQKTGMSGRVREAVAGRPEGEEFSAVSIAGLVRGATVGNVRGCLAYWVKLGQLVVATPGRPNYPGTYRRGKRWPAGGLRVGELRVEGGDLGKGTGRPLSDRHGLELQLEGALKQRDAARGAGRESVAEMFQGDVDRIEGELEKLGS